MICTICGGDFEGAHECPGSRVVAPGDGLREVTAVTMKVAYAVRLSFNGGQAQLELLDRKVADLIEKAFPGDPLLKITRGELVAMDGNPYPSAGFLHDGGVRASDAPGPAVPP